MMLNASKVLARTAYTYRGPVIGNRKSFYQGNEIKRYAYHTSHQKKSFCCSEFVCKVRYVTGLISPWFILRKLGVPCKYLINFRRGIKRLSFPWLLYSFPTALAMGAGDILAQMRENNVSGRKKDAKKGQNGINEKRTAKFMLVGLLIIGPILSRWNRIIMRRISFYPPQAFLIKRAALNSLVLSPFLIMVGLAAYDYQQILDCFNYNKSNLLWSKRYKQPFKEIFMANLMTRPLIELSICLLPGCVRPFLRRPYEVLFFAYCSHVVHKYKLGTVSNLCKPPPPPQRSRRFCRLRKSCNT